MRIIAKILSAVVVLIAFTMTSCESREQESFGDGVAIGIPAVSVVSASYDTMTFSWQPVSGAVEYGYFFYNTEGKLLEGGLTRVPQVTITGLVCNTNYTIKVYAYAAVNHEQSSSEYGELTSMTGFYDVINAGGTYTSAITGKNWTTPVLTETRTNEREFGSFVLSSWYNKNTYDLEFTVNPDSTITVTNGELDEATGYKKVIAGPATVATNSYVRKGALIDESRCHFSILNKTLTLYVIATTGSKEGEDTFVWE